MADGGELTLKRRVGRPKKRSVQQRAAVQSRWEAEEPKQKLPEGWTRERYKRGKHMRLGWRSPEGKLVKSFSEFQSLSGPVESSESEYFPSPEKTPHSEPSSSVRIAPSTSVKICASRVPEGSSPPTTI